MLYLFWGVVPKKKKCKLVPRNDLVFVLFLKETLYSKTCNIEESSAHNLLARVIYINRFWNCVFMVWPKQLYMVERLLGSTHQYRLVNWAAWKELNVIKAYYYGWGIPRKTYYHIVIFGNSFLAQTTTGLSIKIPKDQVVRDFSS
jgi:hypothetical protein